MRQPVIFIGMHRSGTSMLGGILENLGLFSGVKKDINNEAVFFQNINTWVLDQCGARWDAPQGLQYLMNNKKLFELVCDYMHTQLYGISVMQFTGIRKFITKKWNGGFDFPWGWKDPRNTFLLPLWLNIYPGAKIIYIERHGVDVAKSLLLRSERTNLEYTQEYNKYKHAIKASLKKQSHGFIDSPRCSTLDGAISLWYEYMLKAKECITLLPEEQVLMLRYEDVLTEPLRYIKMAAEFCGINASQSKLENSVLGINAGRKYSYLHSKSLCNYADSHKDILNEFGY